MAQVVYDWKSTPGCFDPSLHVGTPVDAGAPDPWAITFTTEIRLTVVRYVHRPRQ